MVILTPDSTILQRIPPELLQKFPAINLIDLQYFTETTPPNSIIISDNLAPEETVSVFIAQTGSHLLQYNKKDFLKNLELTAQILDQKNLYFETI